MTIQAMESFEPRELDFVVAHELAHERLGHLRIRKWFLLIPLAIVGIAMAIIFSGRSLAVSRPTFIFSPMVVIIVFQFPYMFWLRAMMRRQELQADRFAVELTQDPESARSALRKTAIGSARPGVHDTDAMAHPTIGARLAALSGI